MNILHLTTILPSPVDYKFKVNDILLRIAIEYEKRFKGVNHNFVLVLPWVPRLIAGFRTRWRDYYRLEKIGSYELEGFNIYVLGLPTFRYDLKIRFFLTFMGFLFKKKKIHHIIKTTQPTMIHAHDMMNNMELAEILKRKYHIEYILTARNVNDFVLKRIVKGKIKPKNIIAINRISSLRIEKFLNLEIPVFPHPVDDSFFKIEKEYHKTEQVIFVTVSSLIRRKNIDKILKALSELTFEFIYYIVGDGPERDKLFSLAVRLGLTEKIQFVGFLKQDQVQNVLNFSDLFILPSENETLGRVYFEAMAVGVPVVASKGTGIDGIIKDREEGFLVNPLDIQGIKSAVLRFFEMSIDERKQMGENAKKLALGYSWDKVIANYYCLYN